MKMQQLPTAPPPTRHHSLQHHHYTFGPRLADSAKGRVYLANLRHARSTFVVIKQSALLDDDESNNSSDEPWNEFAVVHRLRRLPGHANVLTYLDSFIAHQRLHLVMEYSPSGDLFHHVASQPDQRLSEDASLDIFLHLMRGLAYLHRHNIAHRDISLENVLVFGDGMYKLCDFGLSCRADMWCDDAVGKAFYMAPEMVAGEQYDPVKVDIWSAGILLFMMLTGSPFVQLASLNLAEYRAVKAIGCRGLLQHWGTANLMTEETVDLLASMLQHDPEKRIVNTSAVLAHPAMRAAAEREGRRQ